MIEETPVIYTNEISGAIEVECCPTSIDGNLSQVAQPVYGSAWAEPVYASAYAAYSSNNDSNVIDVDVSIVNDFSVVDDEFLIDALQEFMDPMTEYPAVTTEAVALPVVEESSPVFAFAVPEGYLHGISAGSQELIKSDDLMKSELLFADGYFDELIKQGYFDDLDYNLKLALLSQQSDEKINLNLIESIQQSKLDKASNRSIAAARWREKREKRRKLLKEGVKFVATSSNRQLAAAKRTRENGKFKKNVTKWIPVTEYKSNQAIAT